MADQMITTQLVNFHGDQLEACRSGDQVYVSIRRMCECLGLDVRSQHRKLAAQPWAVMVNMTTTGADGKCYEQSMLLLDHVPMWLAGISQNKVAEEVRPKIVRYQRECCEVLRRHFFGETNDLVPAIRLLADQVKHSNEIACQSNDMTRHSNELVRQALDETRRSNDWCMTVINELSRRSTTQLEKEVERQLQAKIGGYRQVSVRNTWKVDLQTNSEIIEIKYWRDWKHAIGQINTVARYFDQDRRIHLFWRPTENPPPASKRQFIETQCRYQGIICTWHEWELPKTQIQSFLPFE